MPKSTSARKPTPKKRKPDDRRKPKLQKDPTLAPRIQAALERGLTITMACAEVGISRETFYSYTENFPDFFDMTMRAQAVANTKAVKAFASGLEPQKVNHAEIDEFSETRIGKDGKPYQYTRTTRTTKLIEQPPDWRAGMEWLKRRDSQNWSDKLTIEIDFNQLETLVSLLKQRGLAASTVFDNMIQELAHADSGTSGPANTD